MAQPTPFFQQVAYFDYFQYILFRPRRQAYFFVPKICLDAVGQKTGKAPAKGRNSSFF